MLGKDTRTEEVLGPIRVKVTAKQRWTETLLSLPPTLPPQPERLALALGPSVT